jgi:hypothetical protein
MFTMARTPGTDRQASSRFAVPITLVAKVSRGSRYDLRTIG